MKLHEGDRVELIAMPDDPCPVESGTRGTIILGDGVELGGRTSYNVAWDNGRTLGLVIPPDVVRIVHDDEEATDAQDV